MGYLRIFNYFKMKDHLHVSFPSMLHCFSLIYLLFSSSLFWLVYKALMTVAFDVEWVSIVPQSNEVFLFDIILLYKVLIAFALAFRLKAGFITYYLTLTPSVEILAIATSWLSYIIIYSFWKILNVKFSSVISTFIWLAPAAFVYFAALFYPLRNPSLSKRKS